MAGGGGYPVYNGGAQHPPGASSAHLMVGGAGGGSPSRVDLEAHQVNSWSSSAAAATAAAAWSSGAAVGEHPQYSVALPGFTSTADAEAAALSGEPS